MHNCTVFAMYSFQETALCRTYAIDPRCPETSFLPGETVQDRNKRLTLAKIGSQDLFAPKDTSPNLLLSPTEARAELAVQATKNSALEAKKQSST